MSEKQKVVSVDDNKLNLMLIESMLSKMDVEITSFMNPVEGYDYCISEKADLILLDYMMPELDGITFIKKLRKVDSEVPVIMITALDEDDSIKVRALESGATEFLNKPLKLYEFQVRVKNLLNLRKNQMLLKDRAAHLQKEVERATKKILERELEALNLLGRVSEYKDTETGAHVSRVAMYAKLIGEAVLENSKEVDMLYHSSPLHDLGKIGIPDGILLKPGKLDEDEMSVMRGHSNIGHDILSSSVSDYLRTGAQVAKYHHERWDGEGYPEGLAGENIPVFGRIVAVCDVFDALMSDRPYKKAWSFDESVRYIEDNSGTMFDPAVVAAFKEKLEQIRFISIKYSD